MFHVVAVQHRVPSIRLLLSEILGNDLYSSVTLVTKPYSSISFPIQAGNSRIIEVATPEAALRNIGNLDTIILDEGGGLHRGLSVSMTTQVAGVEQTTFGVNAAWKCPMVLVCRSAAKLLFESQIIARGILRKLNSLDVLDRSTVGVIGLGALGAEVARALLQRGVKTFGAEINRIPADLLHIVRPVEELLQNCNLLLGCTGTNALATVSLNSVIGHRLFASCSSSNLEFRTLLQQLSVSAPYANVHGWIGRMEVTIFNGGYPINFDRKKEWELFNEISLTRKLMVAGLNQSRLLIGQRPGGIMLDPAVQLEVVEDWLERVPERKLLRVPKELSASLLRRYSEGEIEITKKPYTVHETTPIALARMRAHKEPYTIILLGVPILILPGVWSPAYDWSSLFHIEHLPNVKGLRFLEIGSGCGVISVFAAFSGAAHVVAVDINPLAVENTKQNFDRLGVDNAETYLSDGLANVHGLFDVIMWNAPYHGSKPADMLEHGCADEGYHSIRTFFSLVEQSLKPGGTIIFGFSKSGDLGLIEELIADCGLRIQRTVSDWREGYNCMILNLVRNRPIHVATCISN